LQIEISSISGNGSHENVREPDWQCVEKLVQELRSGAGTVSFCWESPEKSDQYLTISSSDSHSQLYILYTEEKQLIDMEKSFSNEEVYVHEGVSFVHNTISGFDSMMTMFKLFVDSGKFIDKDHLLWLDRAGDDRLIGLDRRYDHHWEK